MGNTFFKGMIDRVFDRTFKDLDPQNYKGISRAEDDIDRGRTVSLDNARSKRYTYGGDIDGTKDASALHTARQMHEAGIDTSVEDRPDDVDERNIDSTAIQGLKYNPRTGIAEVTFRGGAHSYAYPGVPAQNVKDVIRAPSKGIAFGKEIKPFSRPGFRGHA